MEWRSVLQGGEIISSSLLQVIARPKILWVTWLLASVLFLVPTVLLLVSSRSIYIPMLALESPSLQWLLVYVLGGIGCIVLVICQILVSLNRSVFSRMKLWTGIAVVCTWMLWIQWFRVTSANSTVAPQHVHSVTLKWNPSSSAVSGYNVYRSTVSGTLYRKINALPVVALTYTDTAVQSGRTYYYVTTAVDNSGKESVYSNEVAAEIP